MVSAVEDFVPKNVFFPEYISCNQVGRQYIDMTLYVDISYKLDASFKYIYEYKTVTKL